MAHKKERPRYGPFPALSLDLQKLFIHFFTSMFPFGQNGYYLENFKKNLLMAIKQTLQIEIKLHFPFVVVHRMTPVKKQLISPMPYVAFILKCLITSVPYPCARLSK